MTGETKPTAVASEAEAKPATRKRTRKRQRNGVPELRLDSVEMVSLVCKYFCQGILPAKIVSVLAEKHGLKIHREQAYRYIAHAAEQGWIQFVAPPEYTLRDQLRRRYPWLAGIRVAHTVTFEDVAHHTALKVMSLLQFGAHPSAETNEVHVGFAGGHAMRRVAQILAGMLRRPTGPLPATIVFHALVAGFDVEDPTTDPNAFFTYFVNDSAMPITTKFVGLHTPPLVETTHFNALKKMDGIKQAFDQKDKLDIIVTSGGSWQGACPHTMLGHFMQRSKVTMNLLEKKGCIGDLMWRPLSTQGPITDETKIRAMTLIELTDLNEMIQHGKSVVLMLGPCRKCSKTRSELLKTILDFKEPLITHLVTDTRSAAEVLGPASSP